MSDQTDRILAALDRLENGQTKLAADFAKLADGQTKLAADFAKLADGQTKLAADFAKLADGQAKLAANVAKLAADVAKLEDRQAILENGLAKLSNDVLSLRTDLMARMDRMQNALTMVRDDIAVNFGATETVRRANDNTRDELRAVGDVVAGMQRQIQRLQTDVRVLKGDP